MGVALAGCLAALVIMFLFAAGLGFIFMLLWNAVVPQVFGLPVLDFPQAFMLFLLIWLIASLFSRTTTKE